MPNEINLFEQEMEATAKETTMISPIPVRNDSEQLVFPGMEEIVQANQTYQPPPDKYLLAHVKRAIEALLFASSEPIPFHKIREVTDTIHPLRPKAIAEMIQELQQEYLSQQRAFRLEEIGQGYILRTCEEYSRYIDLMYRNKRTEKLTQAAAEVLAIIAYRQPITRPQIESIRGVDSTGIVQNLLERQLIEPLGKLEAPGRPTLYGITKDFLKHFGLKDTKDLPTIA